MADKMEKAVTFFKKGPTSEKIEVSETSKAAGASEMPSESKPTLSSLARRIKEVKDKEASEMPLQNKPEQINKKALSLLAGGINRGIEKVSAFIVAGKSSLSKSAPPEPEEESETSLQRAPRGNGKCRVDFKEKPGWVNPRLFTWIRDFSLETGVWRTWTMFRKQRRTGFCGHRLCSGPGAAAAT
jgi:hypothetical protein